MRKKLLKHFAFVLFLICSVLNANAQFTITGNVNASSYTCATFSGNTIIYIGDGVTSTKLLMNQTIDLYNSCALGPIQFIIKNNASVDFSPGNDRLVLPVGSSIQIETGGNLIGGSCNASERIYIGTELIASCNGGAGADFDFTQLISNGGFNYVKTNAPNICGSGTSSVSVSVFPTPTASTTYKLYANQSGGSAVSTITSTTSPYSATLITPTINTTTTFYVEATTGSNTTPRKGFEVTVNPIPTITGTSSSSVCGSGTVTLGATASSGTINWYSASTGGSSLGTGTSFTTPSISSTTSYYVDATSLDCTSTTRTEIVATVNSLPIITSQPINQLECEGNSVKFKVIVTGSGLTYTWQYKRPTDGDFILLTGAETNTSYPSDGEIKIENVGSTQYPEGTQFKVEVSNGSCSITSNTVTLTVNEITNVSGGTNVKQCYGTNYSYTVTTSYPANVVSYQWKKSTVSGVWDVITDGAVYSGATTATLNIIGGTPSESAEYRVFVTFNSSGADCNVASYTRTRKITFLPLLTEPVLAITQPTCAEPTGTINVSVQSASDTYSFDNGLNYQASNVKTGLSVGSYDVIIKNEKNCLSSTTSCQIISETSIWDGSTWLNGTPDANRNIVFQQNFSSTSNIEGCSCQVDNGANVVINGDHTLKVTNAVDVVSGSLTFENNASLVQINDDAVNTGSINYHRYTAPVRRYDFTYWSSPVAGQTLKSLSPNTLSDKYYSYNNGWQIIYNGAGIMAKGKGYSIRAPQTFSITVASEDTNPVFIGTPNNGVVSFDITGNQNHFLGNPYPSAIDANTFLDMNSTALEGTLYFWTHNTAPSTSIAGTATFNYTSDDYATYNRTGGVSTATSASTGGAVPTGKIASGQGFFAPASSAGGTVIFNNSMRVDGGTSGVNNSQFFKLNNVKKTGDAAIEKNRIWLNLTNKEGVFKQTLVGYITGATNDYDTGFDSLILSAKEDVDFYSVNQGQNFAIQGRALPFDKKDIVPLGYKSSNQGNFKISIDRTDGLMDSQQIFLEDTYLQIFYNLKKEPYSFVTEKGIFNNRFVLHYADKNREISELNNNIFVSVSNDEIKLNSSEKVISKVNIYNLSGQLLFKKGGIYSKDFSIKKMGIPHQVLIVKVVLINGEIFTKKFVY